MSIRKWLFAAGAMTLIGWQAVTAQSTPPADAEGIIFERQQIMKDLDGNAEILGDIVAGLAPKDKLAATARAIAQSARDSRESFRAQVPGGRSKPEVWSNNADFMKRMDDFVARSEVMVQQAEAGNLAAVTDGLGQSLPCKSCHDLYRTPKRRPVAPTPNAG
jgi:cytochrome c556